MNKLPFGVDTKNLINDLRLISWEASDLLLYYSRVPKKLGNRAKIEGDNSNWDPVTVADLKVNELIISRLKENYKVNNCDLLSEENAKISTKKMVFKAKWLWVIDPLDGTKDFIQGTGNYAMHLALNYENKPFLGLVLIPKKNELWITDGEEVWGEKRDGTYLRPRLLKNKTLEEMRLVMSKNHGNKNLEKLIDKLDCKEVKVMGSIGCKIASIIRGESDIYISLSLPGKSAPKDWDFAAPHALLKAAGGSITNLDNQELIYNNSNFEQRGVIIASSNRINHKIICSQVKKIIEEFDIYPLKS